MEWQNVMQHDHNKERESFSKCNDVIVPKPAPRLSRTAGKLSNRPYNSKEAVDNPANVLADLNLSTAELEQLINDRILILPSGISKL